MMGIKQAQKSPLLEPGSNKQFDQMDSNWWCMKICPDQLATSVKDLTGHQ